MTLSEHQACAELSENGMKCDGDCGRRNLFAGEPLIGWRSKNRDLCFRCTSFSNAEDVTGWTDVHKRVVEDNDTNFLKDNNCRDAYKWTPFHWYCFVGKSGLKLPTTIRSELLLKDELGQNPLMLAFRGGKFDLCKDLIEHVEQSDLLIQDNLGRTCLTHACIAGNSEAVDLLLNKQPEFLKQLDKIDDTGFTYLQGAVLAKNFELSRLLVARGCDVNAESDEGLTALLLAIQNSDKSSTTVHDIVKLLLDHGANVQGGKAESSRGMTPLLLCAAEGDLDIAAMLRKCGANCDDADFDGCGVMYYAVKKPVSVTDAVEYDECLDSNTKEKDFAAVIQYFDSEGADVNVSDCDGISPLMLACDEQNLAAVESVLKCQNLSVNAISAHGSSALHFAVKTMNEEIVDALLKFGVNVNLRDHDGFSPLHHAVFATGCSEHLIRQLLSHGADAKMPTNEERLTPLHLAALLCDLGVVKLLVEEGKADVNATDKDGDTPLHNAAGKQENGGDRVEVIAYLLEHGAEMEAGNHQGFTPLAAAAAAENRAVAAMFVERGAEKLSVTPWKTQPSEKRQRIE